MCSIKCLVVIIAVLLVSVSARSVREVKDDNSSEEDSEERKDNVENAVVCEYKGLQYNEGEELPTRGMCLVCRCHKRFVEPSALSCAIIDCPWGYYRRKYADCIPVYNETKCCPVSWQCGISTTEQSHTTVTCGPHCILDKGPSGLTECICPACTPPNCPPGCNIQSSYTGPCPGCDCANLEESYTEEAESEIRSTVLPIAALEDQCKCDWRYYKHYETKGCTAVYRDGCDCPIKFDCPVVETTEESEVCKFKGKTYLDGEGINTTNPCEICSCRSNYLNPGTSISCISIECPSLFNPPKLDEGCYEVYDSDKCCPVTTKCIASEEQQNITVPTCEFEGKTYHVGQKMYSTEDPCLICLCSEDWTGIKGSSCHQHDCMLERQLSDLQQGCIPIYHEKTCCPIEFYCGNDETINETVEFKADETDPNNTCVFRNKRFSRGGILAIQHPTNCVTCTCDTPPDFTCVHRSCPRPPNDDYENCRSIYREGQCCPTYDCSRAQAAPLKCDPVNCNENCAEVTTPGGCPMCLCGQLLCSPPQCDPECEVETEVSDGSCPHCKCPEGFPTHQILCAPVKCSPECHEAIGREGCPMCVCGPLCSPPKCEPGCRIQTDLSEGQCPGCVCEPADFTDEDARVVCAPVKCAPQCREGTGRYGCAVCLCDPLCSPPKCDPGCEVEKDVQSGQCPGCVCGSLPEPNVQCSPVKCEPQCREAIGSEGCPICLCDPLCSPPKCDPGCEVETDVQPGQCPGCVCGSQLEPKVQCSPVKCEPQCREAVGSVGCPVCLCDPLCSPPKCDPGCEVETDVQPGQCPGCVCGSQLEPNVQCSPVNCEPQCREATGSLGCPVCLCDPLCSPPKCDPGCEIETDVQPGQCPGCVCGSLPRELLRSEVPAAHLEISKTSDEAYADALEECRAKRCPDGEICMLKAAVCDNSDACTPQPTCEKYEVDCNLPACALGCVLEGRNENNCPICRCSDGNIDERQCSTPVCDGRNCKYLLGPDGCGFCNCQQPSCETKPCPQDCSIDIAAREAEGICLCKCTGRWRSRKNEE